MPSPSADSPTPRSGAATPGRAAYDVITIEALQDNLLSRFPDEVLLPRVGKGENNKGLVVPENDYLVKIQEGLSVAGHPRELVVTVKPFNRQTNQEGSVVIERYVRTLKAR